MKSRIIASAIGKGGQNKTTLVWAIGSMLARDHPVLVIDMDPQQSLSAAISDFKSVTIYDVIGRGLPIAGAIAKAAPQYGSNLDIIPASGLLTGLDAETSGNFARHLLLADALESVQEYNYILIDCPSSQGLLTIAPLCCADFVVSPVSCEPESYHQIERFKGTVELIRRRKLTGFRL